MERDFLVNKTPVRDPRPNRGVVITIPTVNIALDDARSLTRNIDKTFGNINEIHGNIKLTYLPEDCPVYNPVITALLPGTEEALLAQPDFPRAVRPTTSTRSDTFSIRRSSVAGLGMFAKTDLRAGQWIHRERPYLLFPALFDAHSNEGGFGEALWQMVDTKVSQLRSDEIYKLYNCKPSDDEIENLAGLLETNGLHAGTLPGKFTGSYAGVCPRLSRVNHSCSPNAVCTFDSLSLSFTLCALRPIPRGEEIFISYVPVGHTRSQRQKELKQKYAFNCACSACTSAMSEEGGVARSNSHRTLVLLAADPSRHPTEGQLREWALSNPTFLTDDSIAGESRRLARFMEEEGIVVDGVWDVHLPMLCKAYCALKDERQARKWAGRTAELLRAYTGRDGGWEKVARHPERTDWWGSKRIRRQ